MRTNKSYAIAVWLFEIAFILLLSIPTIILLKDINANNKVLNQYDTYVIGEASRNIKEIDRVNDKGKIHTDTYWLYTFSYKYNGQNYELKKTYVDNTGFCKDFNHEETLKIKSNAPTQAIVKREYNNTLKWLGLMCLAILASISSMVTVRLSSLYLKGKKKGEINL